ncbi:MAG: acetolactate synthase, partial [Firmicutes bacterium]|nr:acetolactate synthase [Bacillota bacterium]
TQDFGIFRLIVDDIDKAVSALKEEGHIVKITDVIGCKLEDRPGGLARIVKVISAIGVNMEYMYAFLTKTDSAYLVIRVEDNDAVEAALRARGIPLLQEEDVTAL